MSEWVNNLVSYRSSFINWLILLFDHSSIWKSVTLALFYPLIFLCVGIPDPYRPNWPTTIVLTWQMKDFSFSSQSHTNSLDVFHQLSKSQACSFLLTCHSFGAFSHTSCTSLLSCISYCHVSDYHITLHLGRDFLHKLVGNSMQRWPTCSLLFLSEKIFHAQNRNR